VSSETVAIQFFVIFGRSGFVFMSSPEATLSNNYRRITQSCLILCLLVCFNLAIWQLFQPPRMLEVFDSRALDLLENKDYLSAFETYQKIASLDGDNPRMFYGKQTVIQNWKEEATRLLSQCKYEEALQLYGDMNKLSETHLVGKEGVLAVHERKTRAMSNETATASKLSDCELLKQE